MSTTADCVFFEVSSASLKSKLFINPYSDLSMQAMILAAGFGTRLLPYTAIRPKPLFPLLNRPLLLLTIERLQNSGFDHIIINCHHLGQQIVRAVGELDGVVVIEENEILGTGGGLRGALSVMRDEPLLVTNGDIYHTVDFARLYELHREGGASVSLGMHDCKRFNSVSVSGEHIVGFDGEEGECLAFSGLHVLDPALLEEISPGFSCILERYRTLLKGGKVIHSIRMDDCFWTDMGTPEDYLLLHEGLLLGTIPRWEELGTGGDTWCIGNGCVVGENLVLDDWGALGDAIVGKNCRLSQAIVWDGSVIDDETVVEKTIVVPHEPFEDVMGKGGSSG